MKVYLIRDKKGLLFEPLYLTKEAATLARHRPDMPDPKATYVQTLIVASPKDVHELKALLKDLSE